MRAFVFALTCTLAPLAGHAQTFQSFNHLTVVPLSKTDFEVIEARSEGPRGIWCAAADYADKRLGGGDKKRIYVKTASGPSTRVKGRKAVAFTTNARSVNARSSLSVSVRQPGLGLPVNHAIQFCKDYLDDRHDNLFHRRIRP